MTTSPLRSERNILRSNKYSCARLRASATDPLLPPARSYSSSPSSTEIVVLNEARTEPFIVSQFQPPSVN
ncbi:MAG: hypothetical protein ACREA0_13950, partial [bacterium]